MDKYIIDGVEYSYGEMVEVRDDSTEEWHQVRLSGVNSDAGYKIISKDNVYHYIRKLQPKPKLSILQKQLQEFDKRFPRENGDTIYRYCRLDFPEGDARSIKQWYIDSNKETINSIIDWIEVRCENNIQIHGTDKWNGDLQNLKDLLAKLTLDDGTEYSVVVE